MEQEFGNNWEAVQAVLEREWENEIGKGRSHAGSSVSRQVLQAMGLPQGSPEEDLWGTTEHAPEMSYLRGQEARD